MENNKRRKKLDEFLKQLAKIVQQNPNYYLNDDNVYYMITRSGVSKEDSAYDISRNDFAKWISAFRNSQNMDVFVSDNWKYFCQFVVKDRGEYNKLANSLNHIKLYVPVDSKHLQESAKMIFDFISKNNISHASKIGSDIRCDDIVIRLTNPDDAKKIINFVKNNSYIQDGLIEPNPFAPSIHGVSFVCDGHLSFNKSLATLVCSYINGLKKDRKLSCASFDDFKKYVELYERYLFHSNIEDKYLCSRHPSFQSTGIFKNIDDMRDVYSLRGVFDLFNLSFEKDFNVDKYFELFNNLLDPDEYYSKDKKDNTKEIDTLSSNIRILISAMSAKHDKEAMIYQVSEYVDTGRDTLITRDYGLRSFVVSSGMRESIREKALASGLSVKDFIESTVKKKKSKEDCLVDACNLTYLKYEELYKVGQSEAGGLPWTRNAIYSLIRKNKYTGFTRDLNVRSDLFNNVSADEALAIISSKLGKSVEELSVMDEKQFKEACSDFVKAIVGFEEVTEKVY